MKLVECPRDAMQGLQVQVPTELKIEYLNKLLEVGFHTLDFGSFVSPKAIPQMADTAEVLAGLNSSDTKLLAIVANPRGAEAAVLHERISYLGYPLSVSEEFQLRNTKRDIATALEDLKSISQLCQQHSKELVVYLSMGFGNPYGDQYSPELLGEFIEKLLPMQVKIVSLSDTVGSATTALIEEVFEELVPKYEQLELGVHLHTRWPEAAEKVEAAYKAGCRRLDSALGGMGGCPMAKDELVGNMPTEVATAVLAAHEELHLDQHALEQAKILQQKIANYA
jgi:hydroxymethylglutaryl-CoA lyase